MQSRTHARVGCWASLAIVLVTACGGDVVNGPAATAGGVGGGDGGGSATSGPSQTSSAASSVASTSSGLGGFGPASSSNASSSSGGEIHEMCFKWDFGPPCPASVDAPGYLCTPCPGKGCYFVGDVLSRGNYTNGSCCYEVLGDCIPAP